MTLKPQLTHRDLRIDGAAVHLVSVSKASPGSKTLLLLHGAGMDQRVWAPLLAEFAAHNVPALAVDLPGHGRSEGAALTRVSAIADWVLRLTDTLGEERLALAGHSMGAIIALEAAALLGKQVSALGLIAAAFEMPVNAALSAAAEKDLERAAAMISSWAFGPAAQARGEAEAGRRMIAQSPPGVLAADLRACASYKGAAKAAEQIRCPTVVVAGAKDRMTPAGRGRALAEAIAGAQFVELPEIGHMPIIEAPALVADALVRISK
ncbi:MAG TPA: alpha/beta hydrolase [Alphaproteobacteria bacterium]|nr:alpha/beta hydrolase [Alphaproteobacteria bacterium]